MTARKWFTVLLFVGIVTAVACVGFAVGGIWTRGYVSTQLGNTAWLFGFVAFLAIVIGACGRDQS